MRDKISNILSVFAESLQRDKDLFYDSQEILDELGRRGFSEAEVDEAISHLEMSRLDMPGPFWSDHMPTYRAYSPDELCRLPSKVRGYLWKLKSRGVIDHALEDEIVQKAMLLDNPAGLKEIKTVAALTVFGYEHKTRDSVPTENRWEPLLN